MSQFWDNKFNETFYIYGEQPNAYLKEKLKNISSGKILFPADGEGRNSVYAATLGWDSSAFDGSTIGQKKAKALARKNDKEIDYTIADAETVKYPKNNFDAMALIYAHFPSKNRRAIHRHLATFLKPGGKLLIEAFSKSQVKNQKENPKAGGAQTLDMLYDVNGIKEDFTGFDFIEAIDTETQLREGNHHVGKANVIRILARKK